MELRFSSCTLVVHDVGSALGFYRDVLGFTVWDDGPVSVGPPSQPDVRIVLEPPGRGASSADRSAIEDLMAKALLSRLVFATDDCDGIFERIEASGAEVMQEPIDRPGGVRDCAFLDPSGNLLRFIQRREA
ncbi:VOC family protein [Amycolatopsis roodepoortensis]|uniref:VOC family protein n=1 Tax=Amycolatopsis roodepoortensis TaxID=700274 RepID=UPI00214BABB3|nr:VOC family protein [Amycolatopsis roodepoortensis]UUV34436.1 VOC family protein [Amycolatopsis roodepoortensis]